MPLASSAGSGCGSQGSAERAGPAAGGEEFVAEIAVAVLEIHEIEAAGLRAPSGGDVIVDEPPDVVVRHHRIVFRDAEFPVEHRVAVEDHLLELAIVVRLAEAAGMGELEADDEIVVVACGLLWAAITVSRRPAMADCVASVITSWSGLARPSWRTATASPP